MTQICDVDNRHCCHYGTLIRRGLLMKRHDRRRRLQYKIPLAVFWTLWEQALQRSWSSFCPLERTELLSLDAHNRCRVSPTQPRSTTQMEYRYPNERNDEHESPQSVRRSELYSYWRKS